LIPAERRKRELHSKNAVKEDPIEEEIHDVVEEL
jgi:hypothetical protein